MGYLSAQDMAGQVRFETALFWHLSSNHYPPYSARFIEAMTPVCVEAIEHAEQGEWDFEIEMPAGIGFRGQDRATVSEIVESLHLDGFISSEA